MKKMECPPAKNQIRCLQDISERLNSLETDFRAISPKLCRLETMLQ